MTDRPDYELHIDLLIRSDTWSPDRISKALGVAPSRAWKKGDVLKEGRRPAPKNGWVLASPVDAANSEITDQLIGLSELLPDSPAKLGAVAEACEVVLYCVVYAYKYWPGICLTHGDIELIGRMSAGFEIDLYDQIELDDDAN